MIKLYTTASEKYKDPATFRVIATYMYTFFKIWKSQTWIKFLGVRDTVFVRLICTLAGLLKRSIKIKLYKRSTLGIAK